MGGNVLQGDCLDVMAAMASGSVDLIYLDPPFCSGKNWGEFDDRWIGQESAIVDLDNPVLYDTIRMARKVHGVPMAAYLCYMAYRIVEMHRLLRPTGSIYLHCDDTASHYLKILMDAVWGARHFRNMIVWKRT